MKAPRKKSDEFHWDPPDREWLYKNVEDKLKKLKKGLKELADAI